jgi:hypothetical protein
MNIARVIVYAGSLFLGVSATMYKEHEHHADLVKIASLESKIALEKEVLAFEAMAFPQPKIIIETPKKTFKRRDGRKKDPCPDATDTVFIEPKCPKCDTAKKKVIFDIKEYKGALKDTDAIR